jgi:hypothetical protein
MTEEHDVVENGAAGEPPSEETTDEEEQNRPRRPTLVYGALAAGAAVLVLLLFIVWFSSRDDGGDEPQLCLDITADGATDAILAGEVERIDVLIDSNQPLQGLTAIQLRMETGECRRLPEGADQRPGLYQLLGVVSLYNEESDQRVDVNYLRQEVPSHLLNTSTPTPSITPAVTETATASPTDTSTRTPLPTRTSTVAPPVPGSPSPAEHAVQASPAGSPVPASPVTTTPAPTQTP